MTKQLFRDGRIDPLLMDLIQSLISVDIELRPKSIQEVMSHPFLADSQDNMSDNEAAALLKELVSQAKGT